MGNLLKAGVDAITIHAEAASPVGEMLAGLGRLRLRCSLSRNPGPPLAAVRALRPGGGVDGRER